MVPRSGDVLRITRSASCQFRLPFLFRLCRVRDWPTADGWAWLSGYQLDSAGDAVELREIFVLLRGLQRVPDWQRPTPQAVVAQPAGPARRSRAKQPVQL